ncbi:hypothetical protein MMC09_006851 [Bachmanniomyces sp. S44760]|nr:hypothetical protein [Bachmanniomyces sp. S44760]
MEYIHGETLGTAWPRASESRREGFRKQLTKMIQELREVPNPNPGQVAGPGGGPVSGDRYSSSSKKGGSFGPFVNAREFHIWLRCDINLWASMDSPEWRPDLDKMCRLQDRRDFSTVLSHGNLNGSNILLEGDRIVGIVGWRGAAWYPDYWEYASAYHGKSIEDEIDQIDSSTGTVFDKKLWRQEVKNISEGSKYSDDLEMDRIRLKLVGPIV